MFSMIMAKVQLENRGEKLPNLLAWNPRPPITNLPRLTTSLCRSLFAFLCALVKGYSFHLQPRIIDYLTELWGGKARTGRGCIPSLTSRVKILYGVRASRVRINFKLQTAVIGNITHKYVAISSYVRHCIFASRTGGLFFVDGITDERWLLLTKALAIF